MALPTWLHAAYPVGSDKGWLPEEARILDEEHASTALCAADACVAKDCRAAHPPSLLRNFGATAACRAEARSEGWFETALKQRLLTMRFPVVASLSRPRLLSPISRSPGCAKLISLSLDRSGLMVCFGQSELLRLKPVRRNARRVFAL
jgi:hypothetical protein